MVPVPRGILAVGDGICRPEIEAGVAGSEAVVGDARDPAGVTGFMRRPDMIAAAAGRCGECGGMAGRTFSR